jgi:hypothetical protein
MTEDRKAPERVVRRPRGKLPALARAWRDVRDSLADLESETREVANNLGNVLRDQGERTAGQKGNDLLGQAVEAFKLALQVYTRDQLPQYWAMTKYWAMTQYNVDAALKIIRERTAGQKSMGDAQ